MMVAEVYPVRPRLCSHIYSEFNILVLPCKSSFSYPAPGQCTIGCHSAHFTVRAVMSEQYLKAAAAG
jgi:hypothetical protein